MVQLESKRRKIAISLLLSLAFTIIPILNFSKQIAAHRLFNDDCQIYTWIFHRGADPNLFIGDPIFQYIHDGVTLRTFRAFYTAFAERGVHPLDAANLVSFALVVIFIFSIWWIGYRVFGVWWAFLLVALVASASGPIRFIWGGHSRGFGLVMLFLSFAIWTDPSPRREWVGMLPPIGLALFYPMSLLFTLSFLCLRLLFRLWNKTVLFGKTSSFTTPVVCIMVHLVLFGVVFLQMNENSYGPIITFEQALTDPHWTGEKPRYTDVPVDTFVDLEKFDTFYDLEKTAYRSVPIALGQMAYKFGRTGCVVVLTILVVISIFVCTSSIRARGMIIYQKALYVFGRVPEIVLMPFVAIGLYIAARLIAFRLYLPIRYLILMFPFLVNFFTVAVMSCGGDLFKKGERDRKIGKVFLVVLVFFLFVLGLNRSPSSLGLTVQVTPKEEKVLEFIGKLPKDSLIFTASDLGNMIPLLARRSVLWNFETHHILHPSHAEMMDERVRAGVEFLTHGDSTGLNRFKVTHVVLEGDCMAPGKPFDPGFLVSPVYDEYVSRELTYGLKVKNVVYQNEGWTVMELDRRVQ